jgi:hypothetical protein
MTTNTFTAYFEAAAKAGVNATKAQDTLDARASDMLKAGVASADIGRDGAHLAEFQEVTARVALSAAELVTYADTSLASKIRTKDADGKTKQVNTPRGKLVDRVNSIVKRVRDAMARIEKEGVTRGPKEKSTPTEAFFKAIDGYVERFAKTDASDVFDFDPTVARAALVAMLKTLR